MDRQQLKADADELRVLAQRLPTAQHLAGAPDPEALAKMRHEARELHEHLQADDWLGVVAELADLAYYQQQCYRLGTTAEGEDAGFWAGVAMGEALEGARSRAARAAYAIAQHQGRDMWLLLETPGAPPEWALLVALREANLELAYAAGVAKYRLRAAGNGKEDAVERAAVLQVVTHFVQALRPRGTEAP